MEKDAGGPPQKSAGNEGLKIKVDSLERKIDKLGVEIRRDERALEKMFSNFLGTALALAAALFWRDAILSFIKKFLPPSQTVEWELLVAVIVTVVASAVIMLTSRWSHRK